MENRFTNSDSSTLEASIGLSLGLGSVLIICSIAIIDNGLCFIGLPLGAIGLTGLCSAYSGIRKWLHHRYLIATFKQQTRDLFIFSLGESETEEDDNTVASRANLALHYLNLANNPHQVTVWMIIYRHAFALGYITGPDGSLKKTVRVEREGLTVRETREEYNEYCNVFQAEREQEALIEKGGSAHSDEWILKHWFNQTQNFAS